MATVLEITDANFEAEVLQSQLPVLVDFWAVWCGPCRMIEPVIKELAEEYDGKLKVGKLDVDTNPKTAIEYGVRSIPTLLFYANGKLVDRIVGAAPKAMIKEKITEVLRNFSAKAEEENAESEEKQSGSPQ